jgi:hypothetical protein
MAFSLWLEASKHRDPIPDKPICFSGCAAFGLSGVRIGELNILAPFP